MSQMGDLRVCGNAFAVSHYWIYVSEVLFCGLVLVQLDHFVDPSVDGLMSVRH